MPTRRTLLAASSASSALALFGSRVLAQDATPVASPSAVTSFSDDSHALFQALLAGVDEGAYPGIVIYAQSAGELFYEAAGVANLETGEPLDKTVPFQIGSNTKMFVATIILQLQEEGKIDLDAPAAEIIPDLLAPFPLGSTITTRMLLQHTSGLYDYVEDMAASIFTEWSVNKGTGPLEQGWTPAQIADYVATYRANNLYFYPGQENSWHYSNTNYLLLGLIIEKLTGTSLADNMQTRIFDPLGLTQTSLVDQVWDVPVSGYYQPPFDFDTSTWNLSQGWAAGAIVSPPAELATFLKALLHGDLFTKPDTLALMKEAVSAPSVGGEYGLGLLHFGGSTWGHGGQTLGFNSKAFYHEAADIVYIAWVNTAVPGGSFSFVGLGGSPFS